MHTLVGYYQYYHKHMHDNEELCRRHVGLCTHVQLLYIHNYIIHIIIYMFTTGLCTVDPTHAALNVLITRIDPPCLVDPLNSHCSKASSSRSRLASSPAYSPPRTFLSSRSLLSLTSSRDDALFIDSVPLGHPPFLPSPPSPLEQVPPRLFCPCHHPSCRRNPGIYFRIQVRTS